MTSRKTLPEISKSYIGTLIKVIPLSVCPILMLILLKLPRPDITEQEWYLNRMFVALLKQSINSKITDLERDHLYWMSRRILGSVVVLFSPLSAESLGRLLHVTKKEADKTLEDLYAILRIPKDPIEPIRLHHPSFRNFLINKEKCGGSKFWIDEKLAHQMLAGNSIRLMASSLKQNICSLDTYDVLVTDIDSSRVQQCISGEVQYACLYWIQHLQRSGSRLNDDDQVHQFLKTHALHWLEALGWMRKVSEGIRAIKFLESIALVSTLGSINEPIQLNCYSEKRLFRIIRLYS